jgi:hypothetical protein
MNRSITFSGSRSLDCGVGLLDPALMRIPLASAVPGERSIFDRIAERGLPDEPSSSAWARGLIR